MESAAFPLPTSPAPFLAADPDESLSFPGGAVFAGNVRCGVCERTPLVGETVRLCRRSGSDAWVCALCASTFDGQNGATARTERIRTHGGALTVRRSV